MKGEEQLLHLFDSFWFHHHVLSHTPPPPPPPSLPAHSAVKTPQTTHLPSLHRRSLSNDHSSSDLHAARLETILSGKESDRPAGYAELLQENPLPGNRMARPERRKKKRESKSLSDLEFDELKGFLELGFTFPEEDIDLRLISILPGLQRRGKLGEGGGILDESAVARPYLSEAWTFNREEEEDPLKMWRVPAAGDGVDMKDHLRVWAHTVASSVR